jgi:predicted small lipoprotein YifL
MMGSKRILGAARGTARSMGMAATMAGVLLLVGCGQKGPLFLQPASPAVQPNAQKAPATSTVLPVVPATR